MKPIILASVVLAAVAWTSGAQPAGLFDEEELSEGEKQSLEKGAEASLLALEALKVLKWELFFVQMQNGDCSPAVELEGKAKSGDAESQWLLADLYRQGLCVGQNPEETVRWLKAASQQGYAQAQYELGRAYYTGSGVQKNSAAAVKYLTQASEQGVAAAAQALGIIYRVGEGVPQDIQRALSWFERAIELGNLDAAANAAMIYLTEEVGRVDPRRALSYSLPAAEKGSQKAQVLSALALGMLPSARSDDLVEAHKWANLASTSSIQQLAGTARDMRGRLEAEMTQSDIETAQHRASEWVPKTETASTPEELAQIRPTKLQLPTVDPATADRLNPLEAKSLLEELGVPINKDAFFESVDTDNLGVFKLFHKAGADLETPWGRTRVTPLYRATDWGAQSVFDYLLDERADINAADREDGMTPLLRAIAHDHQYMIYRLLDAGASARQDPKFTFGEAGGFLAGTSPLLYAIMGDNTDLIRRLFKHGASVNERYTWGQTPLMEAAGESPEMFQVLIEYGDDPNAVDDHGDSVIHHILKQTPINPSILRIALEVGADPNPDTGIPVTPLLGAVYVGDPIAVRLLLEHGAELELRYSISPNRIPIVYPPELRQIVMNDGTALMVAAQMGHASVVEVLIEYGAHEDQKVLVEGVEFRASDLACNAGHDLVCNMLK